MSFAEFNSVNSSSQVMVNIMQKLGSPSIGQFKTVVIKGTKGSGRKTLAQHLQKSNLKLSQFEIVELSELTLIEDHKIYICHDMDDIKTDSEIFVIQMPSLSERRDDLVALAEFHIQVHALMNGSGRILISEKAKEKILAYTWPGEFPELERALEQAVYC